MFVNLCRAEGSRECLFSRGMDVLSLLWGALLSSWASEQSTGWTPSHRPYQQSTKEANSDNECHISNVFINSGPI